MGARAGRTRRGAPGSVRCALAHAVVGELLVSLLDGVGDERRDGLLSVIQVHEAADVALHVGLIARVLELPAQLHHLIRLAHKGRGSAHTGRARGWERAVAI